MHITNPPKPDTRPASTDEAQTSAFAALRARRRRNRFAWGGAAVAVLALALGASQLVSATPAVRTATVSAQPAERVLAVTGRVKPRETVQIFPRVAGLVVGLNKDEGDTVEAGELLGQIDPARAEAALVQASAAVDAQRRILAQAERDLERARTLLERGSATVAGVEAATLAVTKGREDLRRLEAARAEAALRLEEHKVIAPFEGRILNRPVDPGQVVDARTTLFEIAPTAAQEIETEVDEAYSMALTLGQEARLAFAGVPETARGRVSYIAPEIRTSTGGRIVRLTFKPPAGLADGELPVGLTVDVNIIVARTDNALTVPRQAIRDIATAPYVLTVKDGTVVKQPVTFIDWPAASVIVTSGVAAGDKVITDVTAPPPGAKVDLAG
jgi:RND family efflux transporter MFP subunit